MIEHLNKIPGIEVIGQASNGFEAVKLAEELNPDVIFLDIQMPKLSGFEVLELLGERAPAVVFCTAFDEFALRAFEVHAVDYLLKPVEPARLVAAVERVKERLANRTPPPSAEALSVAARPPGKTLERVLIRHEGRVHVLPMDRIDFVEAQDDYLEFASGGKRYRKQQTMSDLESQVDPTRFVRIHRSFIMNIERLARIDLYGKDSWLAILSDGSKLPMSRTGHAKLKALIG
jgi:two-component system, LytTR family, response regulator